MLKKIIKLFLLALISFSFVAVGPWNSQASEDITSEEFIISTEGWWIWLWASNQDWTTNQVNFAMWTLIQKMMIAMASLAFLIMVIGWTYMVIHHWEDEFLSKWKLIFMSGVYSLVIALSSYFMVWFVRFILYAE